MVKRPTTPKSDCYTALWCKLRLHVFFRVVAVFFLTLNNLIFHKRVIYVGHFIIALLEIYC